MLHGIYNTCELVVRSPYSNCLVCTNLHPLLLAFALRVSHFSPRSSCDNRLRFPSMILTDLNASELIGNVVNITGNIEVALS